MINVHAYNWEEEDGFTDDDRLSIHAWCLDKNSKPYLLRFPNFPQSCYIELPQYVNRRPHKWTQESANKVMQYIKYVLDMDGNAPEKATFEMRSKLYYYRQGKKYPMLKLVFQTIKAMKHCERLLAKPRQIKDIGIVAFQIWESDIGAIRKMLTSVN